MSNLYKKYRPDSFKSVIGNEDVTTYLEDVIENPSNAPQTYLFRGPTGCGKTTMARILSAELGCDPIDLKELNTANFRGIDTVREIIKNSEYKSMGGDVRVWIIDECHKLTKDAQNALLKLLEDSPVGCFYMLCTTNPEQLIPAIIGRCIDLEVKPLNDKQLGRLLKRVAKKEGAKIKSEVYEHIVDDSKGHPRNALQTLEKVIKAPPEKQLAAAQQFQQEEADSIELCRALLKEGTPWKKVANILKALSDKEPESVRRHVLGYAQSVLLQGKNNRAAFIIEEFWEPLYDIGHPGLTFMCYSVVNPAN